MPSVIKYNKINRDVKRGLTIFFSQINIRQSAAR